MKPVRLELRAQAELREHVRWYAQHRVALGEQFLESFDAALALIGDAPETFQRVHRGSPDRRFVMRRFPYLIVYRNDAEAIVVVAVVHARRRPDYWRGRA